VRKPAAKKTVVKPRAAAAKVYRQEYETRDDPVVELNLERILMWHKVLANICGGISLRISRRTLSRVDLVNWTEALDGVVREMKKANTGGKK
jgi:hypothetical protein